MSLFAAFREVLDTDLIVSGYVTEDQDGEQVSKIRRQKLAEVDHLPAILIEIEDDEGQADLDLGTAAQTGQARVAVVCCHHDSEAASEIAQAVRTLLDGHTGTHAGLTLAPVTYEETEYQVEPADDDSDQADWFLEIPKFDVWYRK
jgi:hypothetical protein